ncbi:MAG: hypothetical protein K1X89_23220 [Myxococcaceae bacterium]|nr:hypothetical protein [Myxococcaceae bacterium]
MLRAGPPLDAAAERLLKRLPRLEVPHDLLTAKAMTDWVVAKCKSYEPQVAEAARTYLSQNLKSRRNGADVEWRFGVKEVKVPANATLASGQVFDVGRLTERFEADAAQHTMHDLGSYMNEWLPRFVVQDLARDDRELWVMEGDRESALARAAADGFTHAFRLETPGAFDANELYLAENPKTGARRYLFAEVQGDSGIATLLRVAGMSKQAAPVSVVTQVATRKNTELLATYQQLRPYSKATKVIVGFKNTVLSELWRRKVLGDGEQSLRNWASKEKVAPGPMAVRIGELPDADSTQRLLALATTLAQAGNEDAARMLEKLKTPALSRAVPEVPGVDPWDGAQLTVQDSTGAERTLALLRTPYGESAGSFVDTLKGFGTKQLGVIGTAGGLELDSTVGTIYVPSTVREDGAAEGPRRFENALGPVLSDGGGRAIRERAQGVSVLTPLDETRPAIKGMQLAGDDFVELELGAMVDAAKGLTFAPAFVVSDVPGSSQTIESQAPNALDASVAKVLDALLKTLDISDVVVPRLTLREIAPRQGKVLADAERRQRLEKMGTEVGLTGMALARFIEKHDQAFVDEPPGALNFPLPLLLERGRQLEREIMQGLTTMSMLSKTPVAFLPTKGEIPPPSAASWSVVIPGTRDEHAVPSRLLTLDASPIDALALDLAKLSRQEKPAERRGR